MDNLIPDFSMDGGVEASALAIYSPDYYTPVPGGDLYASGEPTLSFPQCSGSLYCGEGTTIQDGTSGDPSDTTSIWQTLAGVGGSFLKAFTGSSGGTIRLGGSTAPAPKPATIAPADNTMLYLALAGIVVVVLILATRK